MKQLILFLFFGLSLTLAANTDLEVPTEVQEDILNQELSTIEEGQQQFDHLVEATMEVMGPDLELAQAVEP